MNQSLLKDEEVKLLDKLLLNGIKNGNTVNPETYIPTPEEYRILYDIRNKIVIVRKNSK